MIHLDPTDFSVLAFSRLYLASRMSNYFVASPEARPKFSSIAVTYQFFNFLEYNPSLMSESIEYLPNSLNKCRHFSLLHSNYLIQCLRRSVIRSYSRLARQTR